MGKVLVSVLTALIRLLGLICFDYRLESEGLETVEHRTKSRALAVPTYR
jgi:hypothetical protein